MTHIFQELNKKSIIYQGLYTAGTYANFNNDQGNIPFINCIGKVKSLTPAGDTATESSSDSHQPSTGT